MDHLDPQLVEEPAKLSFGDAIFFSDLEAHGAGYALFFDFFLNGLD
jgi:hypothetical protein